MLGPTAILNSPDTLPLLSLTISTILSVSISTRRACSTIFRPIAVVATLRLLRSKSLTSSSSSSLTIIPLRVGWVTPRASAAAAKLR